MDYHNNFKNMAPATQRRNMDRDRKMDNAVRASLDNIRQDLLRCVEGGELTVINGERSVESVSVVPWDCFAVEVRCNTRNPLVPGPDWKTTLEIKPASQSEAAALFSRLKANAAKEGISVLRFVAVYADASGKAVHGIPVALQRKTDSACWHLAVQYRAIMD